MIGPIEFRFGALFLLLLLFTAPTGSMGGTTASGGNGASGEMCVFTSRHHYAVGDVWYPRLGQRGALHCVACVCQEGGKINCTIQDCGGPECSNAESAAANECCQHCSKEQPKLVDSTTTAAAAAAAESLSISSGSAATAPSYPDSASSLGSVDVSTATTCLHNGNVYRHKERFTSTTVGLKPEHPNQCVQCACEAGMVLCQLRDCPKPECEKPIRTRDDCCPVCPDPAGRVDEIDNSPVIIQQPDSANGMVNSKMEDCISGGRYYLHGTTWHPVMGPFGPMDCVNCICRYGRIECQRLECPNRSALNCERPVKVAGRCCPVCPLVDGSDGSLSSGSPRTSASSFGTGAQHGSRPLSSVRASDKSSNIGRSVASQGVMSARPSNQQGNISLCLPSGYDIVVYRAQSGGNSSEFIQYIFQQVVNGNAVEHHMWMLQSTNTTYKVQDLTREHAEALRQRFRFVLLGATSTKNVKRFTKREKKLKPKCLPNSGCPKKIRRLERNLDLKEVTSRRGCLTLEVEAFLK